MKNIKVLGSGCRNCQTTYQLIQDAAKARGVEIELEKIEDIAAILGFGVMTTPGVVIDGKVASYGRVPSADEIARWLKA